MIHRFKKVCKGLFRGSCPEIEDVINLKKKYNINKIVSLDQNSGNKIKRICKKLNIKQEIIHLDSSKKSLLNLLKYNLKDLLISGGPIFVHCKHGKDRTGLVCALFSCKYLNKSPEEVLEEAYSLDFGTGLKDKVKDLYEKIIRECKIDNNDADIGINYYDDSSSSYLEEADRKSFAPFLDQTKKYPFDFIYNDSYNQSETRENYNLEENIKNVNNYEDVVPIVGIFNNEAGSQSFGPTMNMSGFIYE